MIGGPRSLKRFFFFFFEELYASMGGTPGIGGRRLVVVECIAWGLAPHPSVSTFAIPSPLLTVPSGRRRR